MRLIDIIRRLTMKQDKEDKAIVCKVWTANRQGIKHITVPKYCGLEDGDVVELVKTDKPLVKFKFLKPKNTNK